jgi:hypothetical protein
MKGELAFLANSKNSSAAFSSRPALLNGSIIGAAPLGTFSTVLQPQKSGRHRELSGMLWVSPRFEIGVRAKTLSKVRGSGGMLLLHPSGAGPSPLHRRNRERRSLARTDPAGRGKSASVREPIRRAPSVGHLQADVFVQWSGLDRIPTKIVFEHPHSRYPFDYRGSIIHRAGRAANP